MPRVFFDLEFTGLRQNAQPISLGLVTDSGPQTFYAEFSDTGQSDMSPWVIDNVLPKLRLVQAGLHLGDIEGSWQYKGPRRLAAQEIRRWLYGVWDDAGQYEDIEMWGDVLAYDWVIFCELLGGSQNLSPFIHYIPFDIATVFKLKGIDPDIDRAQFVGVGDVSLRHDALQDAALCGLCYAKLMEEE